MERVNHVWFHLLIILSLTIMAQSQECMYSIFIRTEQIESAATDSIIGLTLYDAKGGAVKIDDVVEWGGLMGPNYNYFELGNLDLFSGIGQCLSGPVCALNVTSDGSGSYPSWYCSYVEIHSVRLHTTPTYHLFDVQQWLSPDKEPKLFYAYVNGCASLGDAKNRDGRLKESLSII